MSDMEFSKEKKFWIIVANSLVYFMLAYIVVIILTNSFSILLANLEGVNGVLYYYGFDVLNEQMHWSTELTFLIFFFGTGFSLVLGLIFERLYKKVRKHTRHYKLFYLWGYMLSFTYFFGNIVVGTFFYFGTGVLFEEFSLPMIFRIVTGIVAFGALIYLGIYATRGFIISLNSYQRFIERTEMSWFMKAMVLYPAVLGNVFILFLKLPEYNHVNMLDTLVWVMLFVPVISLFLNLSGQPSIRFKRKTVSIRIFPLPIIVFIVVVLIYRIGLMNGLEF